MENKKTKFLALMDGVEDAMICKKFDITERNLTKIRWLLQKEIKKRDICNGCYEKKMRFESLKRKYPKAISFGEKKDDPEYELDYIVSHRFVDRPITANQLAGPKEVKYVLKFKDFDLEPNVEYDASDLTLAGLKVSQYWAKYLTMDGVTEKRRLAAREAQKNKI